MKDPLPDMSEPAHHKKSIWVFTPSRTDPRDLEFILVQRQELLQDAVDRVRESALTDHKHHLLFVGQRGCGKTHLVTLIVSRLAKDDELKDHLRIAWLNEDETCTTLLELLLKIHTALEKRYPDEYQEEMLHPAYEMKQEDALRFISRHLLSALSSRTLLVVIENLDAIFEGLGDSGQKQLRSFIQENPRFSLVATAQRLVQDLSNRNSPFFGFFQTEHLKALNVEQATELLQNIARLQGNDSVTEFLTTNRGRARVRAMHHLAGGNHRIYIVLSQFITRDNINTLVDLFIKMVDELTPYYQERIRWLAPLQRKIVEYLCVCESTVPVKEIARKLFATPQTISSQLKDLREKGYVTAKQRGRESLYEIAEPLMRICVEVKDNQRHQPLKLLVDFLRVWYEDSEIKRRLGQTEPDSSACAYLLSAIERNSTMGNLRKQILLEDLKVSFPEMIQDGMIEGLKDAPEEVILAMQAMKGGSLSEAIDYLNNTTLDEATPPTRAVLLLFRAELHAQVGKREKAIEDYTTVIETPDTLIELLALALLNRGIIYHEAEDTGRATEDFSALVQLEGAPIQLIAKALLYRGIVYDQMRDYRHATKDLSALLQLEGAPIEQISWSQLFCAAIYYFETQQSAKALMGLNALFKLPGAPMEVVARAHYLLSEIHFAEGRWSKGFQSLEAHLLLGKEESPPYQESPVVLISSIFLAGLSPEGRGDKVNRLLHIYQQHQSLVMLGDGIVQHIGMLFRSGAPFPSADNLEGWASAWEQGAANMPDFRLSLRLLRTGVDYIKAGGRDPGILLTLTSPERAILQQALGIAEI